MTRSESSPRLWFVRRAANGKGTGRGPRMHYLTIAVNGPKQVTLARRYCGRITFKRSELASWGLSETPEDAVRVFTERANHWHDAAIEDLRRAERDLGFVQHRGMADILRYAEEVTE